ncbi:hypothetical protein BJ878DRAFT_57209 [Calycina marina]|uniref:WW domain-containing protein n=1 Tax=Calycina marina TaxID=1763456 RepID=A0A9P7Z3X0_9HELO|nr:hypothetical protein BJ878DRAFT_57209 [Calycina marina]
MSSTTDNYGAPPPYSEAPAGPPPSRSNHLEVPRPKARNGISPEERRSMEDEGREMPPGWLRTYDPETHHQFFVDTTAKPEPRSIWHHPYDDPQYMQSLPPAERTRIQGLHRAPSTEDIEAESSADDSHDPNQQRDASTEAAPTGVHKLGRKMKDKLTSSTHTEREQKRRHREEQERKIYEQHQVYRRAMSKAMQTGEPQLIGKDKAGKEVYIEPPQGMGGSSRNYGGNGYVISPYRQGGYAHPNARYIRPQVPNSKRQWAI